jgi:ribose 5-phosphate isomerase B
MKVAIASDHAGFRLKSFLIEAMGKRDQALVDLGCYSEEPVDYPDIGKKMAGLLADGDAERGILICGSGIGISIAANRFRNVRAALVSDPYSARLTREHNDANVLCLGGQLIGNWQALECVDVFLKTDFLHGRHAPRVQKLHELG